MDRGLAADERAALLLAELTLGEVVSLLHGEGHKRIGGKMWQVHIRGIARLGMPDVTMADGATGLRGGTQLPAPIGLAATWSRDAARTYGDVLGDETRALGYTTVLGPTLDMARCPLHGRTFESFGEDPTLIAELAVVEVAAIQAHRVMACAKHFPANNVERLRRVLDVRVDRRVLHELYLSYYRPVVRDAAVASIMSAFNRVNGVFVAGGDLLLHEILRERWGFTGWVRNDHTSYHHAASVGHGLDVEMPAEWVYGDHLLAAVADGRVAASTVRQAAHRLLRSMFEFGIFDEPPHDVGVAVDDHVQIARSLAEQSVVLLKNDAGLLPLDSDEVCSIALIGADADTQATYGGGSSNVEPAAKDTILDAISARAPRTDVRFAAGVDPVGPGSNAPGFDAIPSGVLAAADGVTPGVTASYFRSRDFQDQILTRVEPGVHQDDGWYASGGTSHPQLPAATRSARWTGAFTAPVAGRYRFDLSSFDPSRLLLDGERLIDNAGWHDDTPVTATVVLGAGEHRSLVVEYEPNGPNPHVAVAETARRIKLGWEPPHDAVDRSIQAAAGLASASDVAIVVVRDYLSEAQDRSRLGLPNNQDLLVREVAAANRDTIVVLTTGSAVSMPWADDVPAIVEAWYGGSAAGAAVARVLFGDVNPGGRLPISFPRHERDMPTSTPEQFPGSNRTAVYSEGLRVGYRHYLATGTDPLFPFGYGLSYTTFEYAGLELDRSRFVGQAAAADGGLDDAEGLTVSFDVTNTGRRVGAVVPQVYVEFPQVAGEPSRQLKGFDRVVLEPGGTRRVVVPLSQQSFGVYDASADQWKVHPGTYLIQVADSACEIRLEAPAEVTTSAGAPHVAIEVPPLVTAGERLLMAGRVVNDGDVPLVEPAIELGLPDGWSAVAAKAPDLVPPHSAVEVSLAVDVPERATPGRYGVAARLSFPAGAGVRASTTRVVVHVPYPSLAAAFNNAGITGGAEVAAGGLDGAGRTLSAPALAEHGYAAGATIAVAGASFAWPDTRPGEPDNVATDGQAISVEGQTSRLALLVTSTAGIPSAGESLSGELAVVYADGTTEGVTLRVSDWRHGVPESGSEVAVTVPYHDVASDSPGAQQHVRFRAERTASIYAVAVPTDADRPVTGVILPRLAPDPSGPVATMHVFALALASA